MALEFPDINPHIIEIGGFSIAWYGAAYLVSFLIGWRLIRHLTQKIHSIITPQAIDDYVVWIVLGTIIGGRLGYALFYQPDLLIHPLDLLQTWKGGMSFHGGFIGVITATFLFCKKRRLPFLELTDLVALIAPLGFLLGRIANFINDELYGRITDVPWAVLFPNGGYLPRHPSQLYEALSEGLILLIITVYFFYRKKAYEKPGLMSAILVIFYAAFRFICEFFREPDGHIGYVLDFFTLGQCYTMILFILGSLLYMKKGSKRLSHDGA